MLLLTALMRPVIAAAMTRMPDPILSLAAFPVAYGVFNLVYSLMFVLPQVVIALVKDRQSYEVVRRFVRIMGVAGCLVLLGASFTPLVDFYLASVLDVPADVRTFALPALRIMSFYVLIAGWQATYQGLLIATRRTATTQLAATANLITLCLALVIALLVGGLPGVELGAAAYTIGFFAEMLVLRWRAGLAAGELFGQTSKVVRPAEEAG